MKKGIILEQYENYSILFCEDGSFKKIQNSMKHAGSGTEIYYRSPSTGASSTHKRKKCSWMEAFHRLVIIMGMLTISFVPVFTYSERKLNAYLPIETLPHIELKYVPQ